MKIHFLLREKRKSACGRKMYGLSGSDLWSDVSCSHCLMKKKDIIRRALILKAYDIAAQLKVEVEREELK